MMYIKQLISAAKTYKIMSHVSQIGIRTPKNRNNDDRSINDDM